MANISIWWLGTRENFIIGGYANKLKSPRRWGKLPLEAATIDVT